MGIRTKRIRDAGDIPAAYLAVLRGEPMPPDVDGWDRFVAGWPDRRFGDTTFDYWTRHRHSLLGEWIRERPGRRPAAWWLYDSPRWEGLSRGSPDEFAAPRKIVIDGALIEPPLPEMWIPGQYMGLFTTPPWRELMPGDHHVEAVVESEAAYLVRHGLLSTREADAIGDVPDHVTAWINPEAYGLEMDDDNPEPWEDK